MQKKLKNIIGTDTIFISMMDSTINEPLSIRRFLQQDRKAKPLQY